MKNKGLGLLGATALGAGLVTAPAAASARTGDRVAHYYTAKGVFITWDDSSNMSGLRIAEVPSSSIASSSEEDGRVGAAILTAYQRMNSLTRYASDYCTYSPDSYGKANFKPACAAHDACYSPSSRESRLSCDNNFKNALNKACNSSFSSWWEVPDKKACNGVAWVYFQTVRKIGQSHYHGQGSKA